MYSHSYLGPTVPNYATTWPLMTAIDALVSLRIPFELDSQVRWDPISQSRPLQNK
jgi:hypothetical protein